MRSWEDEIAGRGPVRPHLRRRCCVGLLTALVASAVSIAPLAAQQKVPLVLHHLIVPVDSQTYNDVLNSPFIRDQFAATQAPWADGVDGGPLIRLFGKYNFLQMVPAHRTDHVGIVLASERAGGLEALTMQGQFGPPAEEGAVTTHNPTQGMPYFELSDRRRPMGKDSTSERVEFQVLQHTAAAARQQFATDSLSETNRANARFLASFHDPKKLFSRLTGATLAIPVDDIAKIVAVLKRDNVHVTAAGEGAIVKLDGFTLKLVPPWTGAGVKQLQFALTRAAVANPTYRFGPRSQLRFGPGLIAVWDFELK